MKREVDTQEKPIKKGVNEDIDRMVTKMKDIEIGIDTNTRNLNITRAKDKSITTEENATVEGKEGQKMVTMITDDKNHKSLRFLNLRNSSIAKD